MIRKRSDSEQVISLQGVCRPRKNKGSVLFTRFSEGFTSSITTSFISLPSTFHNQLSCTTELNQEG